MTLDQALTSNNYQVIIIHSHPEELEVMGWGQQIQLTGWNNDKNMCNETHY